MTQLPPPSYAYAATEQRPNTYQGLSVAALVLGCLGIFLFWLWAVVPVLAIVFGCVALNGQRRTGHKSSGMAIAGLVLGIVFTVFFVLALAAVLASGTS